MSYGEIYILQNDDGSWLLEEDSLPGSLDEALKWEKFGKHIGEKLTEIALLQDIITDDPPLTPILTLVYSNIPRSRHSRPITRDPRPPEHLLPSSRVQTALALQAIRNDVQHMHYLLTEDQELM
jgi:hypothetical protein